MRNPHQRHKRKSHHSRRSLVWFIIISIVVVLIGAVLGLGGGFIDFLEKHANILDNQYIPMDLDRHTTDALKEKLKDIDPNKLEQLKREFLEKKSKQQDRQ